MYWGGRLSNSVTVRVEFKHLLLVGQVAHTIFGPDFVLVRFLDKESIRCNQDGFN
jgi:hypothetical protein